MDTRKIVETLVELGYSDTFMGMLKAKFDGLITQEELQAIKVEMARKFGLTTDQLVGAVTAAHTFRR